MARLNIISAGAAAAVVATLLASRGLVTIGTVINRTTASARRAVDLIGAGEPGKDIASAGPADAWLIGCPDDAIGTVVTDLARHPSPGETPLIFHLSGMRPASELSPLPGHHGSFHPLRSFADPQTAVERFDGTYVAIEGDPVACEKLGHWARTIGGQPLPINAAHKARYHAASTMAANFSVALLDQAISLYRSAGIPADEAPHLALSLARGACDNIAANDTRSALTGPFVRGDVGTVAAHLEQLPEIMQPMYRALGSATVRLALASGRLDAERARQLVEMLDAKSLQRSDDPL